MKKVIEVKNLPHTVVGHSAVPTPMLSILFTAEGIKALAKKVRKGDMLRYETWTDFTDECREEKHYHRWEIVRKEEK